MGDHEAAVVVGASPRIQVRRSVRVGRHGESRLFPDVPAIEEPLERDLGVLDLGVGIDGDDELVVAQRVRQGRDLGPVRGAVLVVACADELVVVAVNLRCPRRDMSAEVALRRSRLPRIFAFGF